MVSPALDLEDRHSPGDAAPTRPPRWLFKVVDVVSGRTLVEDATARTTVRALATVDSIFDVLIFVWSPGDTMWRQLTPREHRMLWDFRTA
ncbi:MAG: hypothetical protein QOD24_2131 [Solirubrobacteraceae bacterium]|nr:hypothetical protein [Solirubrobacteraceae bacterium]